MEQSSSSTVSRPIKSQYRRRKVPAYLLRPICYGSVKGCIIKEKKIADLKAMRYEYICCADHLETDLSGFSIGESPEAESLKNVGKGRLKDQAVEEKLEYGYVLKTGH